MLSGLFLIAPIIGTRFSTFPGEFNQGLQTKNVQKTSSKVAKSLRKINVDTLINLECSTQT